MNLPLIRRLLLIGTFAILAGFAGFLWFVNVRYFGLLTGKIILTEAPGIITALDSNRYENLLDAMHRRQSMPYPPPLPNVFSPEGSGAQLR